MIETTRLAGLLVLVSSVLWPAAARAAHPLLTEDTGTQGAGHYQLELTHDLSHSEDAGAKERAKSINAVFSIGLTDTLDAILGLPYEQLTERTGSTRRPRRAMPTWKLRPNGASSKKAR